MKLAFLIGRIAFGGFFLYNGINHFKERKALAQYAAAKKVPAPDVAIIASGVVLLIGGTSIVLGLKPKVGAAAIMAFLASGSRQTLYPGQSRLEFAVLFGGQMPDRPKTDRDIRLS